MVIDMGAMVGGYSADLTRTICLGQAPPAFIDRYNTVLRAQRRALARSAAMSGREADAVAREELSAAGYGDQFLHGLGHGVGLNIHEFPSLGKALTTSWSQVTSSRLSQGLFRGLGWHPYRGSLRRHPDGSRCPFSGPKVGEALVDDRNW